MQPENSHVPAPSAEQLPAQPTVGAEYAPVLPPLDAKFERGQERVEQAAEAGTRASDAATSASTAAAIATPAVPVIDDTAVQPTTGTTPLVAADEDLIEKEWVDKAKEIIERTRDDPFTRTKQVNELQRDYLQKRYGKVVGASE